MLEIPIVDQITSTSARLVLGGGGADPAGVSTRWEAQVAVDPKFRFCVAPMWSVPNSGDGTMIAEGLNAGTTYYARARNRYSASVEEWGATTGFTTAAGAVRDMAPARVLIEPAVVVVSEPVLEIYWSTGTLAGFPARNLLIDSPVATRTIGPEENPHACALFFRTAGGPVDTLALLNSNMPETATIEIWDAPTRAEAEQRVFQTLIPNAPFRASANLPGRPGYHSLSRSPTLMRGPWFVMVIQNAPTSGRIKHFEHLVVGRNRSTKNHSVEMTFTPAPLTSVDRLRSGVVDRVAGIPMRRAEFELAMLDQAQFQTHYQDMWRYENKPVLIVPNSKPGSFLHDEILYGDLTGGRVSKTNIRYSRGFAIQSLT